MTKQVSAKVVCRNCEKAISPVPNNVDTGGRNVTDICERCRRTETSNSETEIISEMGIPRVFVRTQYEVLMDSFRRQIDPPDPPKKKRHTHRIRTE